MATLQAAIIRHCHTASSLGRILTTNTYLGRRKYQEGGAGRKIWQSNSRQAKYDFASNCKQANCIYESQGALAECLGPPRARQLKNRWQALFLF